MTRYVGLDNNDLNFIKLFCDHDGCMWGQASDKGSFVSTCSRECVISRKTSA